MTSKVDFRPLIPTHTRVPAHTMPTCKDPHGWRGKLQDSTGAEHSNTRLQWAAAVKDEKRWATWACDSCPHWKTLRATAKKRDGLPSSFHRRTVESKPQKWPVLPFKEHIPNMGSRDSWTPTAPSLGDSDPEHRVTVGCFLAVSVLGRPSAGRSLRWPQRCCLNTITQVGGVRLTSEPRLSPTHWNSPCLASEGGGITKIKRRHLFSSDYVIPYSGAHQSKTNNKDSTDICIR